MVVVDRILLHPPGGSDNRKIGAAGGGDSYNGRMSMFCDDGNMRRGGEGGDDNETGLGGR